MERFIAIHPRWEPYAYPKIFEILKPQIQGNDTYGFFPFGTHSSFGCGERAD
jgi:hypothetical protein